LQIATDEVVSLCVLNLFSYFCVCHTPPSSSFPSTGVQSFSTKKLLLFRSGSQEGLLSCLSSPQKNKDCLAHNKFELFLLTMPPLLLSNNLTPLRKDKNLCFVNACLQVLFAIKEIKEFFQAVDPEPFPTSWPVSKELCRIFASDGNYEISAANFRR
jgi:hypothetical protein